MAANILLSDLTIIFISFYGLKELNKNKNTLKENK